MIAGLSPASGPRLPRWPHRPGSGTSPDSEPLELARAACPGHVEPAAWQAILPYRYGFALLAGGFYWEAHEVWEAVWMACRPNSRERRLLQGLIQLANARLKAAMGRSGAVARLRPKAAALLQEALGPGPLMGLSLAQAESLLEAL